MSSFGLAIGISQLHFWLIQPHLGLGELPFFHGAWLKGIPSVGRFHGSIWPLVSYSSFGQFHSLAYSSGIAALCAPSQICYLQPFHTQNHGWSSHQHLAFLFILFSEQFVEKSSCSQPLNDLPNLDTHGDFSSSSSPSSLCTEPLIPTTPVIPSEEMAKISCSLETKELWDKFHELGTEMIITKSGR